MRIIVTGGSGFIGSTFINVALSAGYSIMNLDCLSYASSHATNLRFEASPDYLFEKLDITNRSSLEKAFYRYNPDAVIHLAAETHVDRSINSPYDFIQTNIIGTFNLLDVSRDFWRSKGEPSSFRFHHVSTDEVFGSILSNEKFDENSSYDPSSPYSASKASSDHLVRSWHKTYGLPTIITNCSNNYGPYQYPEKLIPVVIINALLGNPIPVYGDGSNIRDWLYVEDHAHALLSALTCGTAGRTYCIGGDNEHSNLEIINTICSLLDRIHPQKNGSYKDLISFVVDRPGHDRRYAIDGRRINKELGWSPSIKFEKGLELTVKWYLENRHWWRPLLPPAIVDNSNLLA